MLLSKSSRADTMKNRIVLLLMLVSIPVVSGVTTAELDWTEFAVTTGANTNLLDTATSGEITAVLHKNAAGLHVAFVDSEGAVTSKTITADVFTTTAAAIEFVTGDTWVVFYYNSTSTDLIFAKTTDGGDTWTQTLVSGNNNWSALAARTMQIRSTQRYEINSYLGQQTTMTVDGGSTWDTINCGSGLSSPTFRRGLGSEVEVWGTHSVSTETRYRLSLDDCATFENIDGSNDYISAGTECDAGDGFIWLTGGLVFIGRVGGSVNDATDGACLWDGSTPDAGRLVLSDKRGNNAPQICYCYTGAHAATYLDDDLNEGTITYASSLSSFGTENAITGSINTLTGSTVTYPNIANNLIFLFYEDGTDISVWISTEIPTAEETPELAEFDSGLKEFVTSFGFKTAESQLLFVMIMTGLMLVMVSSFTKWLPQGRWTNFVLLGASLLIGVFGVVLQFMELWAFTLSLVLGSTVVNGGKGLKETFRELRGPSPTDPVTEIVRLPEREAEDERETEPEAESEPEQEPEQEQEAEPVDSVEETPTESGDTDDDDR